MTSLSIIVLLELFLIDLNLFLKVISGWLKLSHDLRSRHGLNVQVMGGSIASSSASSIDFSASSVIATVREITSKSIVLIKLFLINFDVLWCRFRDLFNIIGEELSIALLRLEMRIIALSVVSLVVSMISGRIIGTGSTVTSSGGSSVALSVILLVHSTVTAIISAATVASIVSVLLELFL
jgi:hypothetical protein